MNTNDSPNIPPSPDPDMLDEYTVDYRKARPNRFAAHMQSGGHYILLDPDVAEVLNDPVVINALLRAVIQAMPHLHLPPPPPTTA